MWVVWTWATAAWAGSMLSPMPWPHDDALVAELNTNVRRVTPQGGSLSVLGIRTGPPPAISPDGDRLIVRRDRPAVWSMHTGQIVAEWPYATYCSNEAWSGDGASVAAWCGQPDGDLVLSIWTPETHTVDIVPRLEHSQDAIVWVHRRQAWWVSAPGLSGDTLGFWVHADGSVRPELKAPAVRDMLPDNARHPRLSWSKNGRHAALTFTERTAKTGTVLALAWRDDQLTLEGSGSLPDTPQWGVDVLPDGRLWTGGLYKDQWITSATGEVLHALHTPRVHPITRAISLETGQCPAVVPERIDDHSARSASPDGRWTAHPAWVTRTDGYARIPMPGLSYLTRSEAWKVGPGPTWLSTIQRNLVAIDEPSGKVVWALEGAAILRAAAQAVVVSIHQGGHYRLDFEHQLAWQIDAETVQVSDDGVWMQASDGSVQHMDDDGTISHALPARRFASEHRAPTQPWYEWISFPYGDSWVTAHRSDPATVMVVPSSAPWFGFNEISPWCGTGYTPPALGWLEHDAAHILLDDGTITLLPWSEASARGAGWFHEDTEPPKVDVAHVQRMLRSGPVHPRVRWDGTHVYATLDVEGETPVQAMWPLARSASLTSHPTSNLHAATMYTIGARGWVMQFADGSVSGRDTVGAVVRNAPGALVRPTPLHTPSDPWTPPPPVTLVTCPWHE